MFILKISFEFFFLKNSWNRIKWMSINKIPNSWENKNKVKEAKLQTDSIAMSFTFNLRDWPMNKADSYTNQCAKWLKFWQWIEYLRKENKILQQFWNGFLFCVYHMLSEYVWPLHSVYSYFMWRSKELRIRKVTMDFHYEYSVT